MNANLIKNVYLNITSNRMRFLIVSTVKLLKQRYLVVRIDTNHLCNLKCKMCYFNHPATKRTKPMDISLFIKIASEIFSKTRVVYLSCYAEPLCTPNIVDFLKAAKKYRIPFISITSNCILLTEDKIRGFVDNGLDEIIVSTLGGRKETYEENYCGATWETLWQNLENLDAYKKLCRSKKPDIKFNYIVTKKSINETDAFIEKIKRFNTRYVTFRELEPFENMDMDFYLKNRLDREDLVKIPGIKKKFRARGIHVVDSLQCTEEEKPEYRDIPERFPCIQPFFQLYIRPDGDLRFCLFKKVIGNLKDDAFNRIMQSEKAQGFFKNIKNKSTCECIKNCPHYNVNVKVNAYE